MHVYEAATVHPGTDVIARSQHGKAAASSSSAQCERAVALASSPFPEQGSLHLTYQLFANSVALLHATPVLSIRLDEAFVLQGGPDGRNFGHDGRGDSFVLWKTGCFIEHQAELRHRASLGSLW